MAFTQKELDEFERRGWTVDENDNVLDEDGRRITPLHLAHVRVSLKDPPTHPIPKSAGTQAERRAEQHRAEKREYLEKMANHSDPSTRLAAEDELHKMDEAELTK